MKTLIYLIIALIFLLTGCMKDNDLGQSEFFYDLQNPGLPEYSEWGYNTFGAYYDRSAFISNDYEVPAKVVVSEDTMSFILKGEIGEPHTHSYYYNYDSKPMLLTFKLQGYAPSQYSDLAQLNDSIIDLANSLCKVQILKDSIDFDVKILEGTLTFKRVQNLFVNKKQVEVILSGYFDFKAIIGNEPVSVSNGRYDVGISDDNFYKK